MNPSGAGWRRTLDVDRIILPMFMIFSLTGLENTTPRIARCGTMGRRLARHIVGVGPYNIRCTVRPGAPPREEGRGSRHLAPGGESP